ncbi:MAG: transcription-repair coupling factor [Acidobacteria bacterium]|nr:transcription-repair coupling factor [Acidobacteriota bacterium]
MIPPALRDFFDQLGRHPGFQQAVAQLRHNAGAQLRDSAGAQMRLGESGEIHLSGLTPTAQALYAVLLHRQSERPVILVTESNSAAENLAETAAAFFGLLEENPHRAAPMTLPAHDVTPYDGLSPHAAIHEQRGIALWRLAEGGASVVAAPVGALLLKTAPPDVIRNLALTIEVGDEFFLEDLEESLGGAGYVRQEPVEAVGQFSVRGGIVDVFSPEASYPVRIEMAGDEAASLREFDPETQKSIRRIERVTLLPLSESPAPARSDADSDALLGPGWEFSEARAQRRQSKVLEASPQAIVVWCEPDALDKAAGKLGERLAEARAAAPADAPPPELFYWSWPEMRQAAAGRSLAFDRLGLGPRAGEESEAAEIRTRPAPRFQGNVAHAMRELKAQIQAGGRLLVAAASLGDLERLADIFTEYEIGYQLGLREAAKGLSPYLAEKAYLAGPMAQALLVRASVPEGVAFPEAGLTIYGSDDIFAASSIAATPEQRKSAAATFLSDLQDLKAGDFVVHAEHGVGRYMGMTKVKQGEREEELMVIEYADRAKLYVPLARLDLVQKHHGAGGRAPAMDRMGGQTWSRTKTRIKAKLVDMADELLKLYAERELAQGFSYSPDGPWQQEFEDSFKYTPTADQLRAVKEVKTDMESPKAMDRLVCGDVGFGKTEVAMRAAFKALGDDKQVAVLAPTTVLSFQHFETFKQRFRSFPVTIEMLNRFRSPKEQKEVLERLAAGKVDVVVGTHRILSKDVEFADLGLLIVDEEQRFGVRHKERLKQMRRNVDVLSMSATPIPRTLHMALAGMRDISIIQTPPKDRLAIHTVVAPYSDHLVRTAIEQELGRGGQIYMIHNRVDSIWPLAAHIQELVPSLRIGVGHGQMGENELEKVMYKFVHHEYDLLLATTIVENGLDIPLANTILIHDAQNYGLSELYQLRGRVGRSNRRAYAYLLIPEDRELTDVARKRLAALKEFSELGSGFKIAALDLELRGGGNLLGAEQSGHIGAVGFETYCRLLEETVRELRGEVVEEQVRSSLRLHIDIHIPTDYISEEAQRLRAYKRLAEAADEEQRARLEAELADRYGPLPQSVRNLLEYSLLKTDAENIRASSIERRGPRLTIKFREDSKVDPVRLMEFVSQTRGATFSPTGELTWIGAPEQAPELLAAVRDLLRRIAI